MNTVARPATADSGIFAARDGGVDGGVVLDRPLDEQLGRALAHELGRRADLVDVGAGARLAGRVRQHRDARLDAELRGGRRRRDRDVGELLGGRVGDRPRSRRRRARGRRGHEEHARHDRRRPGLVLMISNAGRIVCAVVCAAPETMPSASPRCTIIVPKYETSVTVSAACVDGHALVRAQPRVLLGEPFDEHGVVRSRARGAPRCRGRARSRGRAPRLLAEDREVGDPRASSVPAARRMRSSSPSGSTMCLRSARARSMQLVLEHQRRDDASTRATPSASSSASVSTCVSNSASAVSYLALRVGGEPAARARDAHARVVGAEVGRDDRQRSTRGRRAAARSARAASNPPLRTMPASDGNVPDACASERREQHFGAVAGDDHDRALDEPRQHVPIDIAATTTPAPRGRAGRGRPRSARRRRPA